MAFMDRRTFLYALAASGVFWSTRTLRPAWSKGLAENAKNHFDLHIGEHEVVVAGNKASTMTINGTVPGPLLRFREGESVELLVTNHLQEDTSLHWHGIILPNAMDGVPQVTFPGIKPGETFVYQYPVRQSGTYWYHSHSGLQQQAAVYGPMIIDPAEPEPFHYDREYVLFLSDWTFHNPHLILDKLKKESHYYNYQQRTVADFWQDMQAQGLSKTIKNRLMWGKMRMDPSDIADITGAEYTYLLNGQAPVTPWEALFKPGQTIRLRIINGSAMTFFNFRIPDLPMTVVHADGQAVKPIEIDELQIGVAETYDVLVTPRDNRAYTLFAESMDRSGYTCGFLAPQQGMRAPVPQLRERPTLTMKDMGHGSHKDHSTMEAMHHTAGQHHDHDDAIPVQVADASGADLDSPGVDMRVEHPISRLHEPGTGLEGLPHRILTYADLERLQEEPEEVPERELILHLTGNMERYMWSFNGKKFSEVKAPIRLQYGERVRITMINHTMMNHPIHLHGYFMELDNGRGRRNPKKHTITVKPAEKLSFNLTADALGHWAFHCHLLYHMELGMFRVVAVEKGSTA